MPRLTMLRRLTPLLAVLTLGGCTFPNFHPLVIAPTKEDWLRASSLLDAKDQRTIDSGTGTLVALAIDGAVYRFGDGPPAAPAHHLLLQVPAVISGYNRTFNAEVGQRWLLTKLVVFAETVTSADYRHEQFEIDATFLEPGGATWAAQGIAVSPGVNVNSDYPASAVVRDANVGFAEAFLRLMANAKRHRANQP